jgi:hypothetical protein
MIRYSSYFAVLFIFLRLSLAERKVVLLGDSLISFPFSSNNLEEKIQANIHSNETLLYINAGNAGEKIESIMLRSQQVLLSNKITERDFVILYWDSDCSDIDEYSMGAWDVMLLRARYLKHIQETLDIIRQFTSYVAVAGPTLLVYAHLNHSIRFILTYSLLY